MGRAQASGGMSNGWVTTVCTHKITTLQTLCAMLCLDARTGIQAY